MCVTHIARFIAVPTLLAIPERAIGACVALKSWRLRTANSSTSSIAFVCANQQGHGDAGNVKRVLDQLRHLFTLAPSYRETVKSLCAPGYDFEGWSQVPEFKKLLEE